MDEIAKTAALVAARLAAASLGPEATPEASLTLFGTLFDGIRHKLGSSDDAAVPPGPPVGPVEPHAAAQQAVWRTVAAGQRKSDPMSR